MAFEPQFPTGRQTEPSTYPRRGGPFETVRRFLNAKVIHHITKLNFVTLSILQNELKVNKYLEGVLGLSVLYIAT